MNTFLNAGQGEGGQHIFCPFRALYIKKLALDSSVARVGGHNILLSASGVGGDLFSHQDASIENSQDLVIFLSGTQTQKDKKSILVPVRTGGGPSCHHPF